MYANNHMAIFSLFVARLRKISSTNLRVHDPTVRDTRTIPSKVIHFISTNKGFTSPYTILISTPGGVEVRLGCEYYTVAQPKLLSPQNYVSDLRSATRRAFRRALRRVARMPVDGAALMQLITVLRKYLISPDTYIAEAYYCIMLN